MEKKRTETGVDKSRERKRQIERGIGGSRSTSRDDVLRKRARPSRHQ